MKLSLLPPNATKLEKHLEQSMAFDLPVETITQLWDLDTCPVSFLYVIGLMLGLTNWDESWPENIKRQTLKTAYQTHKIEGTPLSIRQVIINAGYGQVDIAEGLNLDTRHGVRQRNGHFYRQWEHAWCQLAIYLDKRLNTTTAKQLRAAIDAVAPTHCQLVALHVTNQDFLKDCQIYHNGHYTRGTY